MSHTHSESAPTLTLEMSDPPSATAPAAAARVGSGDWLAAIDPGREYYSRRSDSWTWIDGKEHWWEIFVVFHNGFHGGGGACITERWRWNGSSENIRQDPKNLSYEDTIALVTRLLSANNVLASTQLSFAKKP